MHSSFNSREVKTSVLRFDNASSSKGWSLKDNMHDYMHEPMPKGMRKLNQRDSSCIVDNI